ncbi:MAG: TIGR04283 family arsenosugar biosynthesis glycosyltransferase [Schleiferiaceae bacterium]|nr:TIGR04283 family arsenosugar biosynthesis glycosyltransferase [Schleiferiaceae bacterium]
MARPPAISIIIPVLNEKPRLSQLLPFLQENGGEDFEIILADGGSQDQSQTLARKPKVRWLRCPTPGRGAQLNEGARVAQGHILFFLYADCLPPADFTSWIMNTLEKGFHSGSFRLRFDWNHWFLRLNAWFTRFPSPWIRFGDQGFFTTRPHWEKLGGYRANMQLMEDQELFGRYMKRGKHQIVPAYMTTSARRYQANGPLYLQFIFLKIWWRYHRGASQERLMETYRHAINDPRRA